MEVDLRLSVFMCLIQVSLAAWQRLTVIRGQTLTLSCPHTNAQMVDWKNPEGYILFFNRVQGLKDKRNSIQNLSTSQFTITISNVTFKDGGMYTCCQYGADNTMKKVEVTVLGRPTMQVAKHEGKFAIKCTAEGNLHPPQIFWRLNHGPEILAQTSVLREDKKYVSTDILHVQAVESRATVECLVRHPAHLSRPMINFVRIGKDSTKSRRATTVSSPTTLPQRSTTSRFRHGGSTDVNGPSSSESDMLTAASERPLNRLSTSNDSTTPVPPTTGGNHNTSNATSPTGSSDDPKLLRRSEGSSSVLVFLVTCLVFGLLVVVIFLAIKLRRAHVAWKKENEDTSEESTKSKSSQEESNSQGQRRRGLFNTAFTKYVVEKPAEVNSVTVNKEETSQPQTPGQTSATIVIKETEL